MKENTNMTNFCLCTYLCVDANVCLMAFGIAMKFQQRGFEAMTVVKYLKMGLNCRRAFEGISQLLIPESVAI